MKGLNGFENGETSHITGVWKADGKWVQGSV